MTLIKFSTKVFTTDSFHYEFSTDQTQVLYQVSFTYFGSGKGDYQLQQSTNNGRVFQYVGTGLGDYMAVRKLPAPEKSQVYSANVEYALMKVLLELMFR
jgi:hypothetical protein